MTRYAAHKAFVAPAIPSAALWRLILGFLAATAIYLLLNNLMFTTLFNLMGPRADGFYDSLLSGKTPMAMFLLLGSFGLMIVGVAVVTRVVHKRPVRGLIGPSGLVVPQFWAVLKMLVLLGAVTYLLPPWNLGAPYVPNLALGTWLMLLPFSLLGVLVQVSAEEIVFRGYVQQQLAARFNSPLVWMVLPAVIFALGHYLPDQAGENALVIALWAGVFGMLMADLTARAGSLGPAIAVHFCNNVAAIVITSLPDDLSGLALYLTPFGMDDVDALRAWLPVDFALMLVSWLAARLAIRR
ncbi:CPBP family intramembrane glutamic endopeptidase [Sulfitobacter pontiacus]|uniref:CPBP family intramembrane glutamic endopeptidase n=1 Tax=Sulfitobacter pontiacus TaxID=60137 RepID=UPI0015DE0336|nr:type II CAAX endopeptidase family protein [Sulfitobacter pontiacus]QLL41205.1 CPBP family intramembrane metalloprotease [Sulfitobacter pontiacus]